MTKLPARKGIRYARDNGCCVSKFMLYGLGMKLCGALPVPLPELKPLSATCRGLTRAPLSCGELPHLRYLGRVFTSDRGTWLSRRGQPLCGSLVSGAGWTFILKPHVLDYPPDIFCCPHTLASSSRQHFSTQKEVSGPAPEEPPNVVDPFFPFSPPLTVPNRLFCCLHVASHLSTLMLPTWLPIKVHAPQYSCRAPDSLAPTPLFRLTSCHPSPGAASPPEPTSPQDAILCHYSVLLGTVLHLPSSPSVCMPAVSCEFFIIPLLHPFLWDALDGSLRYLPSFCSQRTLFTALVWPSS